HTDESGYDLKAHDELLAEYVRERSEVDHEPVRPGFGSLDADIRGVSRGRVLGIGARTVVGKTWMLNSIEHYNAGLGTVGSLMLSLRCRAPSTRNGCSRSTLTCHRRRSRRGRGSTSPGRTSASSLSGCGTRSCSPTRSTWTSCRR